jgi:hypothetical protein
MRNCSWQAEGSFILRVPADNAPAIASSQSIDCLMRPSVTAAHTNDAAHMAVADK